MSGKISFMLIGAIIGAIAGGLFTGCVCCKEYKKRIRELEDENARIRKNKRERKARELVEREAIVEKQEKKLDEAIQAYGYSPKSESEEEDEEFDADEDVEFDDPFESTIVKPIEEKTPSFKMMTQEDYESDFEYRESESLTFYQKDNVLADAFDDAVEGPENIVGAEALSMAASTDDGYVYVLDEVEDKMYEIEINHEESFYRDILRGEL